MINKKQITINLIFVQSDHIKLLKHMQKPISHVVHSFPNHSWSLHTHNVVTNRSLKIKNNKVKKIHSKFVKYSLKFENKIKIKLRY